MDEKRRVLWSYRSRSDVVIHSTSSSESIPFTDSPYTDTPWRLTFTSIVRHSSTNSSLSDHSLPYLKFLCHAIFHRLCYGGHHVQRTYRGVRFFLQVNIAQIRCVDSVLAKRLSYLSPRKSAFPPSFIYILNLHTPASGLKRPTSATGQTIVFVSPLTKTPLTDAKLLELRLLSLSKGRNNNQADA